MVVGTFLASRDEKRNNLGKNTIRWFAVVGVILVAITYGGGLFLFTFFPPSTPCCRTYQLTITKVTFCSTAGQVTFALNNDGSTSVTIIRVVEDALNSANMSVSTNATLPAGAIQSLTVTFQNVTFQPGVTYDFTLICSQGNKFPTSGIP